MSSAVVSTPAALGRPFVFEDEAELVDLASARRAMLDRTAEGGCPHIKLPHGKQGLQESPLARVQSALNNQKKSKISPATITPASQLEIRPAPEMVSSGVPAIDTLTGGLPRGCLTEVCGPASSGRTTILLAALAAATHRGEFCVVVDASDALDPQSAAAAGVQLDRLLWVRCGDDAPQQSRDNGGPISRASFAREAGKSEVGIDSQATFNVNRNGSRENKSRKNELQENAWKENPSRQSDHRLEQVLRATDLLLESGGFGLIVLDLGDLPPQSARRIPLTTWFRYRRTIEHTPTILLTIEQQAIAGSCSSLLLQLSASDRMLSVDEPAAERRKIAAHGISRGSVGKDVQAPEGQKKICDDGSAGIHQYAHQSVHPSHTHLLTGLEITAELIRSRLDRKPARSVAFESATAWAG